MTKEKFTLCIGVLQELFGTIDSAKNKALYLALFDMTDSDMERAVKTLTKTFSPTAAKPFPLPVDFLEAVGKTVSQQAQYYLSLVQPAIFSVGRYRSVDFGCPALHSVINRYGGWVALCDWTQEEWNINEQRLLNALEAALISGDDGGTHLAGIIESTNGKITRPGELQQVKRINGKIRYVDKTNYIENKKELVSESKEVDMIVNKYAM